ncbi:cytidine deaminase [Pleurocapsales cyanobacterium LEGE 06147]|nr:cytidine deaminase [Pleurocapsales cyanobacterium LEGE 06147]
MPRVSQLTPQEQAKLLAMARQAGSKAYAPYSQYRVGAAVLTEAGNIFVGCNVENVSYGLTICAERNAIAAAIVGEGGDKMKIKAIAVVNELDTPCSPCGACRQVIREFGSQSVVIFQGEKGIQTISATQLLPEGFAF